jgi:hypothetical protein
MDNKDLNCAFKIRYAKTNSFNTRSVQGKGKLQNNQMEVNKNGQHPPVTFGSDMWDVIPSSQIAIKII